MWVDNEEKRQTIMRVKLLLALSLFCPAIISGQKFTNYFNGEPDCYDSFMSGIFRFAISDTLNMEVCLITSQNVDGEIIIPENVISPDNKKYTVTSIASQAFWNLDSITSIIIPESVIEIGSFAFSGCSRLSGIRISANVDVGDGRLFWECDSLKTAGPIGSGCNFELGWVDTIPERIFNYCFNEVILPEGITEIPYEAFSSSPVEKVSLPSTLISIREKAFMSAKRLKSIVVPNSVKAIGTLAFAFCDSLESVVLSNKIEQIPDACFKQCKSLDNIIIPGSVVSIGQLAFEGCAFKSVILTDNLVSISEQAFCYCDSLRNIFNYSISPQLISNDTFIGCHNVVLHVKQGYHEPYRSSLWSQFIIKDDI